MSRKLWRFNGGLHLPDHKGLSTGRAVAKATIPAELVLPLQQHIGAPAKPVVAVGEKVLKGQMIAKPEGFVSAPVHAPTSGTITAIEERPAPHPSGLTTTCIVIRSDGEDTWAERKPVRSYADLDPSELRNVIRNAGIVGLGGAGFPAYIKLNPGSRTAIDTLILNGAECEPYITCDDMLMRTRAEEIVAGARIMRHALQARECLIGIEDNKPEAIAAMRAEVARQGLDIEVVQVPTRYPTGGEKQLIKVLTDKEVKSQGLPIDIGIVCHNVATAAAVHRAVELDEPLISRLVTVTGEVEAPQNIEALFGTPMADLVALAGGPTAKAQQWLMGGPMMGVGLERHDLPVIKTANCILLLGPAPQSAPVRPCIRCGECARACPAQLQPQQLYWYAKAKDFDKTQDYHLFDCIECGCCTYVCPANLPLVQYYRFAKTEIWAHERDKRKSDLARQRHEFRTERIEREKAERAEKIRQKKEALAKAEAQKAGQSKAEGGDEVKKAAIKAAMERAKAKREANDSAPRNTDNLTEAQQRQIDEVNARRAASKAKAESQVKQPAGESSPDEE